MPGTEDLGMLKESEESEEGALRSQLHEKERENDKVSSYLLSFYAGI